MNKFNKGTSEIVNVFIIGLVTIIIAAAIFITVQLYLSRDSKISDDTNELAVATPQEVSRVEPSSRLVNFRDTKFSFQMPDNFSAYTPQTTGTTHIVAIKYPEVSTTDNLMIIGVDTIRDSKGDTLPIKNIEEAIQYYEDVLIGFNIVKDYEIGENRSVVLQGTRNIDNQEEYQYYQLVQFPDELVVARLIDRTYVDNFESIIETLEYRGE